MLGDSLGDSGIYLIMNVLLQMRRLMQQVAVGVNMVAAPGSDPHSDLSEQTLAQSPAGFVGLKLGSHATPAASHKPGS